MAPTFELVNGKTSYVVKGYGSTYRPTQLSSKKKVLHGLPGILPSGIRDGSGTGANFKRTIWLVFYRREHREHRDKAWALFDFI